MTYAEWIKDYIESIGGPEATLQKCGAATEAMVHDFPELKRVRGHVLVPTRGEPHKKWPHWWCVAPNGDIVDPTAAQFPFIIDYIPHDEAKGEPTGKCPDCGDLVYGGSLFCDEACEAKYREYLGTVNDS